MSKTKKPKNNYIDNNKMYEDLVVYKQKYREAKKNGTELPRLSNYLGECLMMIAERLSTRPQFVSYIFREEMIADAIENSIVYVHNFDEKKYNNPFGYFTQIIWYAFLRRIYKEKRQLYIKHKISENNMLFDGNFDDNISADDIDLDSKLFNDMFVDNDKMNEIVKGFEATLTKKKAKRKAKGENKIVED